MNIHVNIDTALRYLGVGSNETSVKVEYNNKVKAFNMATAAVITALALTVITGLHASILAVGLIAWGIRSSIHRNLNEVRNEGPTSEVGYRVRHILGLTPVNERQYTNSIRDSLDLFQHDWQPDAISFFDFIVWKNEAPVGTQEVPL